MAIIDLASRRRNTAEARADSVWSQLALSSAPRYPLGAAGAVIMMVFVFAAIFADFITRLRPDHDQFGDVAAPPGDAHPLGADFMGRDIFSRIVYGARISLAVGLGSTAARLRVRRRARA